MEEWAFKFAGAPARLAAPVLVEKQANALRKTQDELIDEVQEIADRWCARRHKTVEAMFDLSVASLSYAGPIGAAESWMRFCKGTVQRLSEDAGDQMDLTVTLAKCCGNGLLTSGVEQGRTSSRPASGGGAKKRRAKPRGGRARGRRA